MVSDEERREVAEQLREARPSTYYDEELVEIIEDALLSAFHTETWREPTDVLASLADLIEPQERTCRNVSGYKGAFECSECRYRVEIISEIGNECGEMFSVPLIPSYCSGCGARIVGGDGE